MYTIIELSTTIDYLTIQLYQHILTIMSDIQVELRILSWNSL